MNVLIPIVALLVVLALGLVIVRIATVALTFTGLSKDLAWFQAHSAFMGVGFTTTESEHVLENPVRRRIIWWLMMLGNAGLIASVSSLIPIFITSGEGVMGFGTRLLWLASGLTLLWAISVSHTVDKLLFRAISYALRKWTRLHITDYSALLQLNAGYNVMELSVGHDHWLTGKTLATSRLQEEGIRVLGIKRATGEYLGAPSPGTRVRHDDKLIVYGKMDHIAELENRRADAPGDAIHIQHIRERQSAVAELDQTQGV